MLIRTAKGGTLTSGGIDTFTRSRYVQISRSTLCLQTYASVIDMTHNRGGGGNIAIAIAIVLLLLLLEGMAIAIAIAF